MRTPSGTVGDDIEDGVTTLARVMKVTRKDGTISRFTDHDEDIIIVEESTAATDTFTLEPEEDEDAPIAASNILSLVVGQNAANNETVTIAGKVYTYKSALTNTDGFVKIGANAAATLDNLRAAINLGTGAGTKYAAATTLHPTVTATTIDATAPIPAEATLIDASDYDVTFSNLTNEEVAFDGDKHADFNGQPKTDNCKNGMWVGVTFTSPKRVAYVLVWPAQPFGEWNSYGDPIANVFGAAPFMSAENGRRQMLLDGFDV